MNTQLLINKEFITAIKQVEFFMDKAGLSGESVNEDDSWCTNGVFKYSDLSKQLSELRMKLICQVNDAEAEDIYFTD